ncbi:MAG: NUDIX hydrolase [Acaryochloridaceae cyanobacterium SU_2_1]|nr:NUDIX hydrolase [Acaryochloridaceae cyanobacterium SU_2_1]
METSNLDIPSCDRILSTLSGPSPSLAEFKVGVDNVIFSVDMEQNHLLVLLVKCPPESSSGEWSLPGTLVRQGESLEAAAYRILAEKLQVENLYLEQLYTFGGPDRDPHQAPDNLRLRYLSVSYFALVRSEAAILIADSACQFHWHSLVQLGLSPSTI